jgi:ABC-type lipoprotein export system ATPase subunit
MNNIYPKGSEWRIWDLHIHTPESILNNGFGNDWDNYVKLLFKKALELKITCLGICDYYIIEGYKKLKNEYLLNDAKLVELFTDKEIIEIKKILILPNLEFRLKKLILAGEDDLKWNSKVNYHILFSDEVSIFNIEENFLKNLKFEDYGSSSGSPQKKSVSHQNLKSLGERLIREHDKFKRYDPLYVGILNASIDDEEITKVLNEQKDIFGDKYLLGLPADEDLSSVSWNSQGHLIRKVLIQKSHLIFSSNKNTKDFCLGLKHPSENEYLKEFGTFKPVIWGSDSHSFENFLIPDNNNFTWIKADPTFNGLKQIIHEPDCRIFIGDKPAKLINNDNNIDKVIKEVIVDSAKRAEKEWFDNIKNIEINSGLISIIGKKGSGKSALADIIGSAGNANAEMFSFLDPEKFLSISASNKYTGKIVFLDNLEYEKIFINPTHNAKTPSKVVYFSQFFVQKLCEDIDASRFQDEIDRVIFSHIPEEEKLKTEDLQSLINIKTKNVNDTTLKEKQKLIKLNDEIEKKELYIRDDNKDKIKNKLAEKIQQYDNLKKSPPEAKNEPSKTIDKDTSESLTKLNIEVKDFKDELDKIQTSLSNKLVDRQELIDIIQRFESIEREISEFKTELENANILKKYELKYEDIITINLTLEPIKEKIKSIDEEIVNLQTKKTTITKKLDDHIKKIKVINDKFDYEQKIYQKYLEEKQKWEDTLKNIQGSPEQVNTVKYYENELKKITDDYPKELKRLYSEREKIAENIVQYILLTKDIYPSIYEYVKKHSEEKAFEFGISKQDFILFDAQITFKPDFVDEFLGKINQKRKGTFSGIEEGKTELKKMFNNIDLNSKDDIIKIPQLILNALKYNLVDDPGCKVPIDFDSQLLNKRRSELYNYLYSFDYLQTNFDITFGGGRIQSLSPGEKGNLLLIFYLLIDKDLRPIIIDQPEDNLDNETVYEKLVPFIRKIKEYRQIILVTHNPNLAIVCDSEQIIHAKIDKDNKNLISYESGSIEALKIREIALNILEGTRPAFKNRKDKYSI